MKYMAMIFEDEKVGAKHSPEERQAIHGRFMKFASDTRDSGHFQSGNPLQPTATATTIRVNGGKAVTTDGPYAETKEQLAGYFIFECKDLDEAIDFGAQICKLYQHPAAAVEIRPVRPM